MKKIGLSLSLIFLIFSYVFSQDSIITNGYMILKHANGKIASEGTIKDGLPDGYWKSYNNKGFLISEGNRVDFQLDGLWKFYSDSLKLSMSVNFKQGKKDGLKISYFLDEIIEELFKDDIKVGIQKHFSISNHKLIKTIPYENGLEEGIAKEYNSDGTIILLTEYRKGYVVRREFINRVDAIGKKQGTWKYFYDNDLLKTECSYVNDRKHGFLKEYDIQGNLLKIEKYENDQLIIDALETRKLEMRIDYYSNGTPKIIGTYYNGIAEGVRREYNEKGKVVQSYVMKSGFIVAKGVMDDAGLKQGKWEEYYDERYAKPNEKLIRAKGTYKNSKQIGEWIYYLPNGNIEIEGGFNDNGKKEGLWTWYYTNGSVLITENFVDGNKEGLYTEYDENKKVIISGNFIDDKEDGKWIRTNKDFVEQGKYTEGKREGFWKGFYTNGKTCYECYFNNDNFDNKYSRYWENGSIKEQGNYVLGLKHGTWKQFDEQGSIYLVITYKKGVEIRFEGVKIEPMLDDKDLKEE